MPAEFYKVHDTLILNLSHVVMAHWEPNGDEGRVVIETDTTADVALTGPDAKRLWDHLADLAARTTA